MGDDELAGARRDIALGCRILARCGLVGDVLGHISLRVAPDRLLVRCRGPQERGLRYTTAGDVRLVDFDGSAADAGELAEGWAVPNELPIHTGVLSRRPDVTAVVHAHPPAVVAADLAGLALRPIFGAFNIPAARLAAGGIPVYPRSVLIRRDDLAAEMAGALGDAPACLLRGHGIVTVGATVAEAVLRALDVDTLARTALDVVGAGGTLVDIPEEDLAELPDLGRGFNEALLWRHHVARLEEDGLGDVS